MKHQKYIVPKEVYGSCNIGEMIHNLFGAYKLKSYEEAVQITDEYISNLSAKKLEEIHQSSQLLIEANKDYKLPSTEVTFYHTTFPGLMKMVDNFLEPSYHSALKTR
ncbi:MAG: hypothetical protein KAH01_07905, partial [Caldisericia bacterium]|nr:hypothetical protein [Caldisericia bacterium]